MANHESTFAVFSLVKIAFKACNEIQQHWYNELNVQRQDIKKCCKSLFEIISLNTNGGEFDPHGDRRSMFNKVLNIVQNIDNNERRKVYKLVCSHAARNGHFDCLRIAHEMGFPWGVNTTFRAAEKGYLQCLIYLRENECPWNIKTCTAAAENGHMECLRYAHENACPWDIMTLWGAADMGQLEILKYLLENGCPRTKLACTVAAFRGHTECLMYLHRSGVEWDKNTTKAAAGYGSVDCLRYAHRNGCEMNRSACLKRAIEMKQIDCVKYLIADLVPELQKLYKRRLANRLRGGRHLTRNNRVRSRQLLSARRIQFFPPRSN
ncbi:uncharacterized protein LOC111041605 [Myzus persicae]|uniref:uncharacterized protein LOC111041605 n=1 Tax=Myzus persicae TaxID=13164 RepID=UPI000B9372ED|nr:uncharacterized protein LOC111041605 [Myzus persicae]